jgi:hypothetical protein
MPKLLVLLLTNIRQRDRFRYTKVAYAAIYLKGPTDFSMN